MFSRSFTLQDMCLISIVRDIELFVYNKTIPQKHIDFLFQAYADIFFAKHKILKESINEDCMMWFLNPHVKKVTLPPKFHSKRIMHQLKTIGPGIKSLNLHKSEVSESELNSIICCLPHVVHLDLSETSCSNETLVRICKFCRELESLNVSFCDNINDFGMKVLCNSKLSLKRLNVLYSGLEISDTALMLNKILSLECVECDSLIDILYQTGKNKKYNLTELLYDDMLDNSLKTIKACTRMCPKLKKLHFEFPVKENVLKTCVHFQNLEELKIKSSHRYYAPVKVKNVLNPILPISKKLKTLILSCVEISALTLIEHFSNLKNLYLKKVSFTPLKKQDVNVTETNLTTLVIKDMDLANIDNVNYEVVSLLISLSKNVTKLVLSHIHNLPSEIFDVISASMNNLTSVNFSYTHLTIDSLNRLFEISSLDTITANDYNNAEISNLLAKSATSTLSWRKMYDYEDDENREIRYLPDDNDDKYFYDNDSDKSDTISDACDSTTSESDDDYLHYGLYNCECGYDCFNNCDLFDPYDYDPYNPYTF